MQKKCEECKKEYEAERKSRKYCSQLCYRKAMSRQLKEFMKGERDA